MLIKQSKTLTDKLYLQNKIFTDKLCLLQIQTQNKTQSLHVIFTKQNKIKSVQLCLQNKSLQTRYVYKTKQSKKFTDKLCLQNKVYKHVMFIKQKVYIQINFTKQKQNKCLQLMFTKQKHNTCLQFFFYKHVMFTKYNRKFTNTLCLQSNTNQMFTKQ